MENIEKCVDHLSSGWSKLQVITQSKSEYIEERQKEREDAQRHFEEEIARESLATPGKEA